MLSKKADLKSSELIGVLGASIICAKQGCEADGPEIHIGPLTIRLYQGPPKAETPRREKGKQLSLFDITKRKAASRGVVEARKLPSTEEKRSEPPEEIPVKKAETPPKKEEPPAASQPAPERAPQREIPRTENAQPARQESAGQIDRARLVESIAEATGLGPTDAERVLSSVMTYLSNYPSVGILRFLDDIRRSAKVDPDIIKRILNVLRSYDVVELHELGVVNLKKSLEIKRETKL